MYDEELVAQLQELLRGYVVPPEHVHALVHMLDEVARARPPKSVEPAARHTPTPPPAASDAFGAIEDLGLLGEVEHIRIHRARDPELRREVALLLPAVRSGAAAAIVREARLLARLRHPCVPVVLGHGALADGTPCTAMEMPETQPLSQLLAEPPPGSGDQLLNEVVAALARVASALAHAHGLGVVNRTLAPRTVQMARFGRVRIACWAWALDLRSSEENISVDDRALLSYLDAQGAQVPPELRRRDRNAQGPWTDVYGVGALLLASLSALCPAAPPAALLRIGLAATAEDPRERTPSASALARDLSAWAGSVAPVAVAEALFTRAEARMPAFVALRETARRASDEAARALQEMPPDAPMEQRAQAWALEDEGVRLAGLVAEEEHRVAGLLHGAILDGEPEGARARLTELYRARRSAPSRGGLADAETEALLTAFSDTRARPSSRGWLSLSTSPSHASVLAYASQVQDHKPTYLFLGELGNTPLRAVPLEAGSYLLVLRCRGHVVLAYPVQIQAGEHLDAASPGPESTLPLALPSALSEAERYVPAGWSLIGDPDPGTGALPERRLFLPGFGMRARPLSPAELGLGAETPYDDLGFEDAVSLAAELADRTGQPWRLPTELEWERAARGADGRAYPWGPARSLPLAHVEDRSPFGLMDMGTGIAEWCVDAIGAPVLKGVLWDVPATASGRSCKRARGLRAGVRLARDWGRP